MTAKAEELFAELNRIAVEDGWPKQKRKSMIGVFKCYPDDEARAHMLEVIRNRRPHKCQFCKHSGVCFLASPSGPPWNTCPQFERRLSQ